MLARRDDHCSFESAVQSYGHAVADRATTRHHEGRQQESFRIDLDGGWQSVWLFMVLSISRGHFCGLCNIGL